MTLFQRMSSTIWKFVAFTIIAMTMMEVNAIPRVYNATDIHTCRGKAYDSYSRKALSKMLRVTNASVWEGRNVWGCEYAFVQDGFHEFYQEPMELIRISPECCDKCLSNCPEFRLRIEGCADKNHRIDFNITQVCVVPWKHTIRTTRTTN